VDPYDLGQGFLAATAVAGAGSGTMIPGGSIHRLIGGRHHGSRYGAEVNVP